MFIGAYFIVRNTPQSHETLCIVYFLYTNFRLGLYSNYMKNVNFLCFQAQRERFNQLKIHTSTKLQMSADKIKLTQSELDNITEKIGNLEMNLSDAIKNMYSNKNKLVRPQLLKTGLTVMLLTCHGVIT